MFDDLIEKKQGDYYSVYDYGTIYVDFNNKIIEFKGDFKRYELENFNWFMNNKYDDIMDEILNSGKWTWIENNGKILKGEKNEEV